jgi:hypothetical protein
MAAQVQEGYRPDLLTALSRFVWKLA